MSPAQQSRLREVALAAACHARAGTTETRRRFRVALSEWERGGEPVPERPLDQAAALIDVALIVAQAAGVAWEDIVASVNTYRREPDGALPAARRAEALAGALIQHFDNGGRV